MAVPGHISNNPTWVDYPTTTTQYTAQTSENLEAVLDGINPFVGLRPRKLYMRQVERASVAQNAEYTMATITGPGVIRSLWLAIPTGSPAAPSLDGRIRIYYDGASTPAVDIDCGTLFAVHYGATGTHYTPHLSAQLIGAAPNAAYMLSYPIPFGTSVRIAFYNPVQAISSQFYFMATYNLTSSDTANGLRLRAASARLLDQQVTVTAAQSYPLANIGAGPGWVVGLSYVGGVGATNLTWLERNIQFAVDGESTPAIGTGTQIITTGLEDTFDSGWYYFGYKDFMSSQHSYVGADAPSGNPYVVGQTTDFWSKWGGIPFNTSCVATMFTESGCTTGHGFSYALLYYS